MRDLGSVPGLVRSAGERHSNPLQYSCLAKSQTRLSNYCVLKCFSHVWLFATLGTVACQAPLSMGILQARILEWVALSSSSGSSQSRNGSSISCISFIVGGVFTAEPRKPLPLLQKSRSHSFYLSPTIFTILTQFYFLPNPRIESWFPILQTDSSSAEPPGKPITVTVSDGKEFPFDYELCKAVRVLSSSANPSRAQHKPGHKTFFF